MTTLSAYLHMEAVDTSEPASFYAPGAFSWADPNLRFLRWSVHQVIGDEDLCVDEEPEE